MSTSTVEEATQAFWAVSKAYNRRSGDSITVQDAIQRLNPYVTRFEYSRPIARRVLELSTDIIYGRRKVAHGKAS